MFLFYFRSFMSGVLLQSDIVKYMLQYDISVWLLHDRHF